MQDAAEPQVHDYKKLILVAIADILILSELCVAMYYASQSDNVNSTFMSIFFGACIPTLLALLVAIFILRKRRNRTSDVNNPVALHSGLHGAQQSVHG
ncbi:hypothetical protein [Megalodesulfovibrio paquesii]